MSHPEFWDGFFYSIKSHVKRKYLEHHGSYSQSTVFLPHMKEMEGDSKMRSYYGYGWVIDQTSSRKQFIWHDGGNGILFAQMFQFPEEELVLSLMTNKASQQAESIGIQLLRLAVR